MAEAKKKATKKVAKKTTKKAVKVEVETPKKVAKKVVAAPVATPKKVVKKVAAKVEEVVKKVTKKSAKKVTKKTSKVSPQRVLRTIELNYYSPASELVQVAGSFNDWDPAKGVMTKSAEGHWSIRLEVEAGKYEYKYVFDGESWEIDPKAPQLDSDFGPNNLLQVD